MKNNKKKLKVIEKSKALVGRLPSLIHKLLRPEVARLEHVDIGHLQLSSSHSALKLGQLPADFNISDGDNGHKNTSTSAQ
ncbi:hypothetical protein ACS0TY_024695 [Phlomoides rotata]